GCAPRPLQPNQAHPRRGSSPGVVRANGRLHGEGDRMTMAQRLDRFQPRRPGGVFPLAVLYKCGNDSGAYLAALIAYYGFVSFFPLLLLMSTVLSFVLSGHPALQQQVLDSALSQ